MNELKYKDVNIYPMDIQPIIKVILAHEGELTWWQEYGAIDRENDNEIIAMLTAIAYELLTEVKKALENQIPMWEFKDGQFTPLILPKSPINAIDTEIQAQEVCL